MITILDCYTDEPSGLGVPPFLGVYPRYIFGEHKSNYLTIDDLRFFNYEGKLKRKQKTDIKVYNLTKNYDEIRRILQHTTQMIIIAGVHTPGKYLSAVPGTLKEISSLLSDFKFKKTLTGPAVHGTAIEGGKFFEHTIHNFEIENYDYSFDQIKTLSVKGAEIIKQIPSLRVIEIETGRGCSNNPGCSFCTEPIKNKLEYRNNNDIIQEMEAFYKLGVRDFRLGKQACFYSLPNAEKLLDEINSKFPDLRTLHIDNVNPVFVVSETGKNLTKKIVETCSSGNIAAFGVESFDKDVISANNLNCTPELVHKAIKIINEYGKEKGENGMPKFLPGLNILFGLENESKKTHEENMKWLKKFLDEDLLLRRINIRQVNIFEGTPLYNSVGNKFLRKNKKYYWKWRNEIRQNIDLPMLKKLLPIGTILKDVRMEIHDGKTTFGRQLGTYPLIVGIEKKLELNKFYDVKIKNHYLRSVVAELV